MNGLMSIIQDQFLAFFGTMLFIARYQIRHLGEVAILVFILSLALAVIFLCARLMKKYDRGFGANVLLAFLVLSLALGLMGFLLSIPRLSVSAFDTFLVVAVGSPVVNLTLSGFASLGHQLLRNHSKAGAVVLCGVGLLFAWVLLTTFILFMARILIT